MKKAKRDTAHLKITFRPGRPTEIGRTTIARLGYFSASESHTWADQWARAHDSTHVGD